VPHRIELRIPFATLVKVALFILLCLIVIRLKPLILMTIVAGLLAVVLTPFDQWLEKRMRRGLAMTLIALLLFGLVAAFLTIVIPQTAAQGSDALKELPRLAQKVKQIWPGGAPYVDTMMAELKGSPQPQQMRQWLTRGMTLGRYALGALTALLFTLVLALYFVVDGKRALAWAVTFAPREQRRELVDAIEEARVVVFAYMRGQLITSTLSFAVAASVLLALRVPAALPLAVLAFIGDFIPVAGFVISLVPAVLLALTVSPTAALIVAAVYFAYQMCENYLISPRVYGRQMELSTLAVLLAIAVGAALMGPIGAILILPFASAWPTIEKIWLADRLPEDTIAQHDALESGGEAVADRIL
jgi:predicted PurR-regulated permease PerM